ncbi:flavodoxin domain-containing protein [Yinghuangia soli]|uniref:Flavodoxin domain-containing protein n=1 Tax=Yinghuangia soli TaxID=2908204 RepID=A0AA41Q368_9ACTN|nr:flavodoxin domain-containing protein [Yinghuangia soli]MCF2529257.1 flavodoxin domain-containing protein [Yinghuangia soli]
MLVLITYATRHGSTRSIADRIGERPAEHSVEVEVLETCQVGHLWQYRAVIAGSAIHDGDFRDWAEIDEWALGIAEKLTVE